eukprot:gene10458-10616_t
MASRNLPGNINFPAEEQSGEATSLWALQQYDAALQTLQRLDGMLPEHKVQLNMWVAQYYSDAGAGMLTTMAQFAGWLVFQSVEQQGGMLMGVHLQALLHLYKARLAMGCNNFKAAKKECALPLHVTPSYQVGKVVRAEVLLFAAR